MPELNVPQFSVAVPMRCHAPVGASPLDICGELATWLRPNSAAQVPAYFCDAHHDHADIALPGSYVFRRIHIEAVFLIASASRVPGAGQVEAIAKLERAVVAAGAVPDWLGVRSTIGRFTPRPPSGQGRHVRVVG